MLPTSKKWNKNFEYADEADILNVAIFGMTAKQWKERNPQRHKNGENIRDSASINELIMVANAEILNAEMMRDGIAKKERFIKLQEMVQRQITVLNERDFLKSLKKTSDDIYIEHKSNDNKN